MASYTLIGSASIVQVLSPTATAEMVAVTIRTHPTGIIVTSLVGKEAFDAGTAGPILQALADAIEAIIGQGKAVSGTGTSGLDGSGLQTYYVTFEVAYNPPGAPTGAVTVDVNVPVGLLSQDAHFGSYSSLGTAEAIIDKAYANLVAMSGSTAASAPAPAPAATTGTNAAPSG